MRESLVTTPTIMCPGLSALTLNANTDCRSCPPQTNEPPLLPLFQFSTLLGPLPELALWKSCGSGRHIGEGSLAITGGALGSSSSGECGNTLYTKRTSVSACPHGAKSANEELGEGGPLSLNEQSKKHYNMKHNRQSFILLKHISLCTYSNLCTRNMVAKIDFFLLIKKFFHNFKYKCTLIILIVFLKILSNF